MPVAFGFFVGFVATPSGLGGGVFLVPFLLIYSGLDNKVSVGTSIAVIAFSRTIVAYIHFKKKHIDYKSLVILAFCSIPGVFIGFQLNTSINASLFKILLSLVLFYVAWYMIKPSKENGLSEAMSRLTLVPIGFLSGVLSSAFGLGSGFISVPTLHKLLKRDMIISVGTSNLLILFFTSVGSIQYIGNSYFSLVDFLSLAVSMIAGSVLAAQFLGKINPKFLRATFSILLFFTAINLLFKEIF
ncbi:MAG: sulfite exporter TauE/SafE family protein [Planctomycetes bacterium]|nr:sulfite exporter TauE/SafE family protein [Planctomycetota bacterium]